MEVEQFIKHQALSIGFVSCAITDAKPLVEQQTHLETWINNGYHAQMEYMQRNIDKRINPSLLVEGVKSIIVLTHNYYPLRKLNNERGFTIARFAYGQDYHHVLKNKMENIVRQIEQFVGYKFQYRVFVDSAPVLERALAVKSGLGWIGRNSHLIQKGKGSYMFISTIFTDLQLTATVASPLQSPCFGCGTCTACVDACPTNAIMPNKTVDSNRCLSYLTIEQKASVQTDGSPMVNSQYIIDNHKLNNTKPIFGCDICQEVCPHNRFATPHHEPLFNPSNALLQLFAHSSFDNLTESDFAAIAKLSPLKRAKYEGLIRNIKRFTSPVL